MLNIERKFKKKDFKKMKIMNNIILTPNENKEI